MKAIYKKPETEVVYLQVEEDIAAEWGKFGRDSQKENVGQSNTGFFGDGEEEEKKDPFFDD